MVEKPYGKYLKSNNLAPCSWKIIYLIFQMTQISDLHHMTGFLKVAWSSDGNWMRIAFVICFLGHVTISKSCWVSKCKFNVVYVNTLLYESIWKFFFHCFLGIIRLFLCKTYLTNLLNTSLLKTYNVPITVVDAGDTAVTKTTKDFVFMESRGLGLEIAI